jgi:hypothetical protein
MKATVLPRQTLLDIAILSKGEASAAIDIAIDNNISLTDDLTIGQEIEVGEISKKLAAKILSLEPPATAIDTIIKYQGINFMEIEGSGEDRFWVR